MKEDIKLKNKKKKMSDFIDDVSSLQKFENLN